MKLLSQLRSPYFLLINLILFPPEMFQLMKDYETISDKVILHVNTVNITEKDRFLGHHILLNFN